MSNSPEKEILAYVYNLLIGDTELVNGSGINPGTGSTRAVGIFNQPPDNTPVPYVRITLTDTGVISDEPFGYDYVPDAKAVSFMIDVFSNYEPECLNISSRLQVLLQHHEVTTTHFHGSTWLSQAVVYFTENIGNPERVYCRASIRVRVNIEPA